MNDFFRIALKIFHRPRTLVEILKKANRSGIGFGAYFLLNYFDAYPKFLGRPLTRLISFFLRRYAVSTKWNIAYGLAALRSKSKREFTEFVDAFLQDTSALEPVEIVKAYILGLSNFILDGYRSTELIRKVSSFDPPLIDIEDINKDTVKLISSYDSKVSDEKWVERSARVASLDLPNFKILRTQDFTAPESDHHLRTTLIPARTFSFREPKVDNLKLRLPERTAAVPPFELFHLEHAGVYPANIVITEDRGIFNCDAGGSLKYGLVAGTRRFCQKLEPTGKWAVFFSARFTNKTIDSAILISGRASLNYFHWMVEYLPKTLAVVKERDRLNGVPLIIDAGMPKNHRASLDALLAQNKIQCPIYERKEFEHLHVKTLFIPTGPISHPDRFDIPLWHGAGVSVEHYHFVRNSLLAAIPLPPVKRISRVLISRKQGSSRAIPNLGEIEELLVNEFAFTKVYPEELTFMEQVAMFNQADVIFAATGAALANLVFAKSGAVCFSLIAKENVSYSIMANFMNLAGGEFIYVAGKHAYPSYIYRNREEFVHSTFTVSKNDVRKAVQRALPA